MALSPFTRLYQKVVGKRLEPLGFRRKGNVFWREREGVLHIILLDRSALDGAFTIAIVIQPLVFPDEGFALSLGARLNRFAPGFLEWEDVPTAKEEIEALMERVAQAITQYAVPWLDRFQSCWDIVETEEADDWGVWPLPGRTDRLVMGLCALDAGLFEKGESLLRQVYWEFYSKVGSDAPEWHWERRRMIEELLKLLERGDREGVQRQLEEYKAYTRAALGIEKGQT